MTDSIADMLNRIRNGQAVLKEVVVLPFSNLKYAIAEIIKEKGFVEKLEKKGRKEKKFIEITLKYIDEGSVVGKKKPVILGLKRISSPGKRVYVGYKDIKPVKGGYGFAVISTPQGLMTEKDAKKKKLGGEVLCEVW